jgi:hypothetical protein
MVLMNNVTNAKWVTRGEYRASADSDAGQRPGARASILAWYPEATEAELAVAVGAYDRHMVALEGHAALDLVALVEGMAASATPCGHGAPGTVCSDCGW